MPNSDRSALFRLTVESLVAILLSALTVLGYSVKNDVERASQLAHSTAVTVEGIRFHLSGLAQTVDRIDAIQRANTDKINRMESRHEVINEREKQRR